MVRKLDKSLSSSELLRVLSRLTTPERIQDYLDTLGINFELDGDTHRSPKRVVETGEAHCIEAALFAATALWYHGRPALIMDLKAARGDYDHVVALYKENGYWGAVSKSNHATIRWRDPVYRSVRELAVSYFHEWFPERRTGTFKPGVRTLRAYSAPLNMERFGYDWIVADEDLWWVDDVLNKQKHFPIAPLKNLKGARRADPMEVRAGSLLEYRPR